MHTPKVVQLLIVFFKTLSMRLQKVHQKALQMTLKFFYDTRAETIAGKFVGMAIGVVISILMLPPVADTILGINTSAWTFTGAEGAKALMYIIPMIYIACVIIYIVREALS